MTRVSRTTLGGVALALGTLLVAGGQWATTGQVPDPAELTLAVLNLLGALGLIRARDRAPRG